MESHRASPVLRDFQKLGCRAPGQLRQNAQLHSHYQHPNRLGCDCLSGPKRVSDRSQTRTVSDLLAPSKTQQHTAEMELHHCTESVGVLLRRPLVLLFVGKLTPRKRPQDLLYVAASLRDRVPHLAVTFVGEGESRHFLESEIARLGLKNVHLLGFKNQSELPGIYGTSDIFVLPSSHDPKPLVTNEAMASGLPIVASDRTGVWGN